MKIGRNDLCPCGSAKKYKVCCLNKGKSPIRLVTETADEDANQNAAGQLPLVRPVVLGRNELELDSEILDKAWQLIHAVAGRLEKKTHPLFNADELYRIETVVDLSSALLHHLLLLYSERHKKNRVRLYESCAYLFCENLVRLRFSIERGRDWALMQSKHLQQQIADCVFNPYYDNNLRTAVLEMLHESKLDIFTPIKEASSRLLTQGNRPSSTKSPDVLDKMLEGLCLLFDKVKAEGAVAIFDAHEGLVGQMKALSPNLQLTMIEGMSSSDHPIARELASLMIFHPDAIIREGTANIFLDLSKNPTLISPLMLRRIICVRSWLPVRERPIWDKVIKNARLNNVKCAQIPTNSLLHLNASFVDGSGVQGLIGAVRKKGQFFIFGMVMKLGFGIRDVWVQRKGSKVEIEDAFKEMLNKSIAFPVQHSYLHQVLPYFIWTAFEQQNLDIARLLQIAELLGETNWLADRNTLELEIIGLEREMSGAEPTNIDQLLAESSTWLNRPFASSWFEDDITVDNCLKNMGEKRVKITEYGDLILADVIEPRRQMWADKLHLMALWRKARINTGSRVSEPSWKDFMLLANEIVGGRPLKEIPLMRSISELSIGSALRRRIEMR